MIERIEARGNRILAAVREPDGTLTAYNWHLNDILDRASGTITSNVLRRDDVETVAG